MGVLGLVVVGGAVATAWVLSSGATRDNAATAPVAPPVVRDSAVRAVSPQLPPLPPPVLPERRESVVRPVPRPRGPAPAADRKSTRLNSSHSQISYAVFCLKKKMPASLSCTEWRGA